MTFRSGKAYSHKESGAVGYIVGKLNSLVCGKGFVMEMFIPGQKPTLQPMGKLEKHTEGWLPLTNSEFMKKVNDINKDRIEDKLTQVKADNCMRGIANRDRNDLHLVITLECGHTMNFSKDDKEPGLKATFQCAECAGQNKLIEEKLQSTLDA